MSVFLIGQVSDVRGDARVNLDILGRLGVTVVEVADSQAWELHISQVRDCTIIVDAIFGTGLNAPVSGLIESVITDINASDIPVVSIDLPSGLSADSSFPIGESIEAGTTVTLAAPKLPLVLMPAEIRAGDIVIADIGIPVDVINDLDGPRVELLTRSGTRELVAPRSPDSHKGDYGHVLIVAGSKGKTGAAHLSGIGALRSVPASYHRHAGRLPGDRRGDGARVLTHRWPPTTRTRLGRIDQLLEMARDVVVPDRASASCRGRSSS